MMRAFTRGQSVKLVNRPVSIIAPASERRRFVRVVTLERPFPGGSYDSGTLWVLSDGTVADESLMTPVEAE